MDGDCSPRIMLLDGACDHIGNAMGLIHGHGGIHPEVKFDEPVSSCFSCAQPVDPSYCGRKRGYVPSYLLHLVIRKAEVNEVLG